MPKNLQYMVTELLFCKSSFTKAVLFLEHLLLPKIWEGRGVMLNREIRFSAMFMLLEIGKLHANL
jgi:hypothetical protein